MPVPKRFAAEPAIRVTVTVPAPDGVKSAVYTAPLPATLPTLAPTALRLLAEKPVTVSLNVMVIGIGDAFVGSVAVEVIIAVGAVKLITMFLLPDADQLPALSRSCT